jgi:valyl-tRNA synthetase
VIVAAWPKVEEQDKKLLAEFEACKEIVTTIRNIRAQKQISPKEKLELIERSDASHSYFDETVIKLANLSSLTYAQTKVEGALSFLIGSTEFYVPVSKNINVEEEKQRLHKDLEYNKGFLKSVQIKLSNEKFVANAKPELIANERKKQADAEAKIKALEEQLQQLK